MKLDRSVDITRLNGPQVKRISPDEKAVTLSISERLSALVQLTKPRIMSLVLITGTTALILEGSLISHPVKFLLFLLGLYMTGGAANAFNQYFERDIDARMTRTRQRRPLPLGLISAAEAVVFSSILGLAGVILLGAVFNLLTALLAGGTMLFYALIYTLWLKPNTPQNIVIGGIAGAMAPVGAWTAATGHMAVVPWILFAIVFVWTPPHFWSLALYFKSDYEQTHLPMMPVVKGEDATLRLIFIYSLVLVGVSLTYLLIGGGWIYGLAALGLGIFLIHKAWTTWRRKNRGAMWNLFTFSIFYLFGLFAAMVADKLILGRGL